MQDNENKVWERTRDEVEWKDLRKFVLFGFGDAGGLEFNKEDDNSVYTQAQSIIGSALLNVQTHIEDDAPVFIIAQSLGCHVISCFFLDAMIYFSDKNNNPGIWKSTEELNKKLNRGNPLSEEQINFLAGKRFRYFYTTGCNIPIFVAAHATIDILPFTPRSTAFAWKNFYDKDDVLGWPLKPLSDQYYNLVKDIEVNAGGNPLDWITRSWNPLSHTQYWVDGDVINPLVSDLSRYLQ